MRVRVQELGGGVQMQVSDCGEEMAEQLTLLLQTSSEVRRSDLFPLHWQCCQQMAAGDVVCCTFLHQSRVLWIVAHQLHLCSSCCCAASSLTCTVSTTYLSLGGQFSQLSWCCVQAPTEPAQDTSAEAAMQRIAKGLPPGSGIIALAVANSQAHAAGCHIRIEPQRPSDCNAGTTVSLWVPSPSSE